MIQLVGRGLGIFLYGISIPSTLSDASISAVPAGEGRAIPQFNEPIFFEDYYNTSKESFLDSLVAMKSQLQKADKAIPHPLSCWTENKYSDIPT